MVTVPKKFGLPSERWKTSETRDLDDTAQTPPNLAGIEQPAVDQKTGLHFYLGVHGPGKTYHPTHRQHEVGIAETSVTRSEKFRPESEMVTVPKNSDRRPKMEDQRPHPPTRPTGTKKSTSFLLGRHDLNLGRRTTRPTDNTKSESWKRRSTKFRSEFQDVTVPKKFGPSSERWNTLETRDLDDTGPITAEPCGDRTAYGRPKTGLHFYLGDPRT